MHPAVRTAGAAEERGVCSETTSQPVCAFRLLFFSRCFFPDLLNKTPTRQRSFHSPQSERCVLADTISFVVGVNKSAHSIPGLAASCSVSGATLPSFTCRHVHRWCFLSFCSPAQSKPPCEPPVVWMEGSIPGVE